jgi:very-short-patch-repair endonuclease
MLRSEGRHFRKQVPLAGYIADFACHSCKLVVELDGGQHNLKSGVMKDAQRTDKLRRNGYSVIRFWNANVMTNLEGVVDMIRHAAGLETIYDHREEILGATRALNPSPQGGGV